MSVTRVGTNGPIGTKGGGVKRSAGSSVAPVSGGKGGGNIKQVGGRTGSTTDRTGSNK